MLSPEWLSVAMASLNAKSHHRVTVSEQGRSLMIYLVLATFNTAVWHFVGAAPTICHQLRYLALSVDQWLQAHHQNQGLVGNQASYFVWLGLLQRTYFDQKKSPKSLFHSSYLPLLLPACCHYLIWASCRPIMMFQGDWMSAGIGRQVVAEFQFLVSRPFMLAKG